MKINSLVDYLSCILFKLIGPLIRSLPHRFVLFLARRFADLLYCVDAKHHALAYANMKLAFGATLSPEQIASLTRQFYQHFTQNLCDIFLMPCVGRAYIDKYIIVEGMEYVQQGLTRGKGVILLGVHAGSWELAGMVCVRLGLPYVLFVRDQGYPRMNELLNKYRTEKGCQVIARGDEIREVIRALKNNKVIGMTLDQGGKAGRLVNFFGRQASMAQGAIRLALKYDASIVPAFCVRVKGPWMRIIFKPALQLKPTGNLEKNLQDNLQDAVKIFQGHIREYPAEYLWTYKIWKYGKERAILVLNDAKAGHLRQSQALVKIVKNYLEAKGIEASVESVDVKYKNKFCQGALLWSTLFAGRYSCPGCLWCLRFFLEADSFSSLTRTRPDIVISAGASLAPVNYIISRESLARSMVLMQPSLLNARRFDLVVVPSHDSRHPKAKNAVTTEGALNLVNQDYVRSQAERLERDTPRLRLPRATSRGSGQAGYPSTSLGAGELSLDFARGRRDTGSYIGLLLGGDTKKFRLDIAAVSQLIQQIKSAAQSHNMGILVTTSRRTSAEIEQLLKSELAGFPACKLLIIANEKNIPEAVGGILGLSKIVVVSPESISMISEASSSGRYVVVFQAQVGKKHNRFLEVMAKKKYIYLAEPEKIKSCIDLLLTERPPVNVLDNAASIQAKLQSIGV